MGMRAKCPCCGYLNSTYIHPTNKEYDRHDHCEHWGGELDRGTILFSDFNRWVTVQSETTDKSSAVDRG